MRCVISAVTEERQYAGASAAAVSNPEDIDLDEGDAEAEDAVADLGKNIQLETKPVPVSPTSCNVRHKLR